MSFVQLKGLAASKLTGTSVNRWAIYKQLCIAKSVFGLNDRCLAVLSALLSFYPENDIGSKSGLVVFPSNRQLALRAHGMPESTLRRHVASLIEAGLILRRDSPNGKRYAYKTQAGEIEEAFGFSVAPLLERASEIAAAAERIQADIKLLKRTRERITLKRRDITQLFDTLDIESKRDQYRELHDKFRTIVEAIPRRASIEELTAILTRLSALSEELLNSMNLLNDVEEMSVNHAQNERHHNESHPEFLKEDQKENSHDLIESRPAPLHSLKQRIDVTIELVLRSCPDINDYSSAPIRSWRDLEDASVVVARCLGIAPTAHRDAITYLGHEHTAAVIAWILQCISKIRCAGAYLRSLVEKARTGRFSISRLLLEQPASSTV
jgi:replication initiation protein RepC